MTFTSNGYKELLKRASKRFSFVRFGQDNQLSNVALWRHDIDFSPQRGLRMAQQEADLSIISTYFVQLSSRFYSIFEPETASVIRSIRDLGHEIGLHFDPSVYKDRQASDLESYLIFESRTLEKIIETEVRVFSLHNPTTIGAYVFDEVCHAHMINASSSALRNSYNYCSDSNGIWRFKSLHELIECPNVNKLYALTHPEWWQEVIMPPRERVLRSIRGRSSACLNYYDCLLAENSRPNLGLSGDPGDQRITKL